MSQGPCRENSQLPCRFGLAALRGGCVPPAGTHGDV